jgi:hypothetical protein
MDAVSSRGVKSRHQVLRLTYHVIELRTIEFSMSKSRHCQYSVDFACSTWILQPNSQSIRLHVVQFSMLKKADLVVALLVRLWSFQSNYRSPSYTQFSSRCPEADIVSTVSASLVGLGPFG